MKLTRSKETGHKEITLTTEYLERNHIRNKKLANVPVDIKMLPLILTLNQKGFKTKFSCQGGKIEMLNGTKWVIRKWRSIETAYISFEASFSHAEKLINAIRKETKRVFDKEKTSKEWCIEKELRKNLGDFALEVSIHAKNTWVFRFSPNISKVNFICWLSKFILNLVF